MGLQTGDYPHILHVKLNGSHYMLAFDVEDTKGKLGTHPLSKNSQQGDEVAFILEELRFRCGGNT